jgi:hypothetical protein
MSNRFHISGPQPDNKKKRLEKEINRPELTDEENRLGKDTLSLSLSLFLEGGGFRCYHTNHIQELDEKKNTSTLLWALFINASVRSSSPITATTG